MIKKHIIYVMTFFITIFLSVFLAYFWKPGNIEHRVIRLIRSEKGKDTVVGQLDKIEIKKTGTDKTYVIGFHFFNTIRNEKPIDVRIGFYNHELLNIYYCSLDHEKFDKTKNTRKNLGFGHSFNIDILLKLRKDFYKGAVFFQNKATNDTLIAIPVIIS